MKRKLFHKHIMEKHSHLSQDDVDAIVQSIVDELNNMMRRRDRAEIRNFGVFQARKTSERIGINPKTKQPQHFPISWTPSFRPSKKFLHLLQQTN